MVILKRCRCVTYLVYSPCKSVWLGDCRNNGRHAMKCNESLWSQTYLIASTSNTTALRLAFDWPVEWTSYQGNKTWITVLQYKHTDGSVTRLFHADLNATLDEDMQSEGWYSLRVHQPGRLLLLVGGGQVVHSRAYELFLSLYVGRPGSKAGADEWNWQTGHIRCR